MAGDIYTASGTKFYISTTAVASTTDTLAGIRGSDLDRGG